MSPFPIPITAIFTALLALMLVGLSIRVVVLRAGKKINYLDGGDADLGRAIRVQGNFTEYVPIALALIGMAEWLGASHWSVYALGAALIVARIVHAYGLYAAAFPGRVFGASVSWLVIVVAAVVVLGKVA